MIFLSPGWEWERDELEEIEKVKQNKATMKAAMKIMLNVASELYEPHYLRLVTEDEYKEIVQKRGYWSVAEWNGEIEVLGNHTILLNDAHMNDSDTMIDAEEKRRLLSKKVIVQRGAVKDEFDEYDDGYGNEWMFDYDYTNK